MAAIDSGVVAPFPVPFCDASARMVSADGAAEDLSAAVALPAAARCRVGAG